MKRTLSALAAVALGAGLAIVGATAPASATEAPNPAAGSSCVALAVDLTGYPTDPGAPAQTHEEIVTPAVAEVSHTDYEYRWYLLGTIPTDTYRWAHKDSGATVIYDGKTWKRTGKTQKDVDVAAVPAVTKTVVDVPARPANATPNTVRVKVDGVVVDEQTFGTTFAASYPLDDKFSSNDYSIGVYAYGETEQEAYTGTIGACDQGTWNPAAAIDTTSTCGAATVTVTNDTLADDRINPTTTAVISVDGKTDPGNDVVALFEGSNETRTYTFPEDSGDHKIVVRTGSGQGDTFLAQAIVSSDCAPNLSVTGALQAGGSITVAGDNFEPNTDYTVELHSDPQTLGTVTTDGQGAFTLDTVVPASTPAGAHEVVVLDGDEEVAEADVDIAAAAPAATGTTPAAIDSTPAAAGPALAETGFDGLPFAIGALALLAVGGVVVGASRAARARG